MNLVACVLDHLKSGRALGPAGVKLFGNFALRERTEKLDSWNAGHGDAERDAVMVGCAGAFEFIGVLAKVLGQFYLRPFGNFGAEMMADVAQPLRRLAVQIRRTAYDVDPGGR